MLRNLSRPSVRRSTLESVGIKLPLETFLFQFLDD